MEKKVFKLIDEISAANDMNTVAELTAETRLREDLAFTSFDLAELTVKIEDEFDIDIFEDGLVNTIGEIYAKLS